MIAKISKGRSFRGALEYLMRESTGEEPVKRPRVIGGNLAGSTPREWSREFGALRRLRPTLGVAVSHFSLSLPPQPTEREVSDNEFRILAETFLKRMGYDEVPFVVVRHQADHAHAHIVASRLKTDGSVVSDKADKRRAIALCRELEIEFGLFRVETPAPEPAHTSREENTMALYTSTRPRKRPQPPKDKWIAGYGDADRKKQTTTPEQRQVIMEEEREQRRAIFDPEWLELVQHLFYVEAKAVRKQQWGLEIQFRDGGTIKDKGSEIVVERMPEEEAARRVVELVEARGWKECHFFGSDAFVRAAMAEAIARGINPIPNSADQALMLVELIAAAKQGGAVGVQVKPKTENVPPHLAAPKSSGPRAQV